MIIFSSKTFLACLLVTFMHAASAQTKYWVFFKDKDVSSAARAVSAATQANRRLLGLPTAQYTDVSLTQAYVDEVSEYGRVVCRSRWLNGVSMILHTSQVERVRQLSFVKDIAVIRGQVYPTTSGVKSTDYYHVLKKINIDAFTKADLSGKGVTVGVIDGRFAYANVSPNLTQVFEGNRVLATRDFVSTETRDFYEPGPDPTDMHGTLVWQLIAGDNATQNMRLGAAYNASFVLARTDDTEKEYRKEEDYLISAMEWMDSLGVRLVNISLGYSLDFTDPGENHKPFDMDGNTTAVAKAAAIAVQEKGLTLIVSAGNDGENNNWKTISTPADAQGVITVGALDSNGQKHSISGVGPDFINYLKPDLACFSEYGTSASAPIITGVIACMLQKDSTLTSDRIRTLLERASHLYPYGNNYVGFGLPDAAKILKLMSNDTFDFKRTQEIKTSDNTVTIKVGRIKAPVIVFHKASKFIVTRQDVIVPEEGRVMLSRNEGIERSTVSFPDKVIEIFWE